MAVKAIDVSEHQGTIDWKKVKASGVEVAILRAGYGRELLQKDVTFEANYKNAKAAGLKIGAYWYSYATDAEDAKKEAKACLSIIKGKTFDLPIFFDLEEKGQFAKGKSFCTSLVKAFCSKIEAGGYEAGLYMSRSPLQDYITETVAKKYPLWVAEYGANCNYKGNYILWQYSESGCVNGISTNVDMDYYYPAVWTESSVTEPKESTVKTYGLKSGLATYSYKADGETDLSEHFQAKEFACMNDAGVLQSDSFLLNSKLVELLEKLFSKLNCKSMVVTSGYRTPSFSVSIGGSATDQHTKGNAADIMCYDKTGDLISSKTVCCTLEDMGHTGGCGYITATATHVDVRTTGKAYFDEAVDGGATVFDSFYTHWGMKNAKKTTTKTVTETAKFKNDALAGTYKTTDDLHIRAGAGSGKASLAILSKGTKVKCFGYYSTADNAKWLYVQVTVNGVQYTGFCCSAYLKKQ